jgi:hypothetical protein
VKQIFFAATRFLASAVGARMDVGIGEIADIAPTGFDVRFRHKADIATAACPLLEVKRTSRFQSVMAASFACVFGGAVVRRGNGQWTRFHRRNSVRERPSTLTGFGKSTKAMAIVGPHRSRPAYPKGLSPKQLANESSYFFFFDLHMVVGHMPLRTLQGEKSPIILRS